ncbi:hypothetical protein [Thalassobacterium sedimentorum]|uniref:ParE family toxin-like protein n=1 Tax=Thalassobacterium sedimentorum TaxID=3041258 RepID=UPI003CE4F1B4
MIQDLEQNGANHRRFRGKQLRRNSEIISVPLGLHWRAIFLTTENGYRFYDCYTHSSYNNLNFSKLSQ